jgi:hypothetical protein
MFFVAIKKRNSGGGKSDRLLEGINTAQGNAKVLVELHRVAFDPLKEISFISENYNKFELDGSLLADTSKPFDALLGQFGRIVLVPMSVI